MALRAAREAVDHINNKRNSSVFLQYIHFGRKNGKEILSL